MTSATTTPAQRRAAAPAEARGVGRVLFAAILLLIIAAVLVDQASAVVNPMPVKHE